MRERRTTEAGYNPATINERLGDGADLRSHAVEGDAFGAGDAAFGGVVRKGR